MVEIRPDWPTFDEFFELADKYRLIPDYWREFYPLALAEFEARIFWTIYKDGERIGYLWIDNYVKEIPDLGCTFGAVVEAEHRRQWSAEAMPALREIIRACFEELRVPRVTVMLDRKRTYAEAFFKKLGFEYEGRVPNGLIVRGRRVTLNHLGMTDNRFRALYKESDHGVASLPAPSSIGIGGDSRAAEAAAV